MLTRRTLLSAALASPVAGQAARAGAVSAQESGFTSDRMLIQVLGRGRDVILVPGLASTGEVWRSVADVLRNRMRVHVVSVRGFGPGSAGANAEGPIIGPLATELNRYIASARLDAPAVIGHSMGALIGMRAAADAGRSRTSGAGRLMAIDAAPFFPALISQAAVAADVEPLARLAYQAVMLLGDGALRSPDLLGGELGGAADSLWTSFGWQGGDRHTMAQSLYEVMTLDLRHRLPDISAPVTVVYGWSRDDASPRAHVDRLFRAAYANLPRPAVFEPIEGAEHMVMIDRPRAFMAAVERFLG